MTLRLISAIAALPLAAALLPAQGTVDRTKPPELGPPPRVSLPPIITRQLPNGLKLMIVEQHELPLADFVLIVGSGGTADPAGKTGVANLTSQMLREGTTTRKSLDIADQTSFLGISLFPQASWESSNLSLHTPTAQLDSALALFADVALHPSFPANEFERIKKNRLTELLQLRDQGPAIANLAFPAILYGNGHPYGAPLIGTEASVTGLTTADLQAYYQANFKPNNATMIIVGDVNPAQIEQKINSLFGGWQRGDVLPLTYAEPPKAGATTIYLIDKPGAAQSSFRIGEIGVPRSTRDYFALTVMLEIDRIRATKISDEELSLARDYLDGVFPIRYETTAAIASALATLAIYELPADYYDTYRANIRAVSVDAVLRAAQTHLHPDRLQTVVVGDAQAIRDAVANLDLGELRVHES